MTGESVCGAEVDFMIFGLCPIELLVLGWCPYYRGAEWERLDSTCSVGTCFKWTLYVIKVLLLHSIPLKPVYYRALLDDMTVLCVVQAW